jgi:hypothetical protein
MEQITYKENTYKSLKEFFTQNINIIPYKSYAPLKKRIDEGENLKDILESGKKKTGANKGPYYVEGMVFADLPSIAKEYSMTERSIYKRYSRGKRNDDLVPLKRRKNYVKPKKIFKFFINGVGYNSKAEACRKNNIKYITYRKRIIGGWTEEEALGLQNRQIIHTNSLASENYHGKKRIAGKKIILEGRTYNSIAEASKFYNKDAESVRQLIISGRTPEEAFGLNTIFSKHSILYQGKKYKNLKDLANKINFPYKLLSSRVNNMKISIEDSINLGTKKLTNKGRYNLTILKRDLNLAITPSELYFIKFKKNNIIKYKIGITTKNTEGRLKKVNFKFKIIKIYKSTLINCFLIEQKMFKDFSSYIDLSFTAENLDGHTEVLNFSQKTALEVKKLLDKLFINLK